MRGNPSAATPLEIPFGSTGTVPDHPLLYGLKEKKKGAGKCLFRPGAVTCPAPEAAFHPWKPRCSGTLQWPPAVHIVGCRPHYPTGTMCKDSSS